VKRRNFELRPFTPRSIIIILDEDRRNLEIRPFDASEAFESKCSAQFHVLHQRNPEQLNVNFNLVDPFFNDLSNAYNNSKTRTYELF